MSLLLVHQLDRDKDSNTHSGENPGPQEGHEVPVNKGVLALPVVLKQKSCMKRTERGLLSFISCVNVVELLHSRQLMFFLLGYDPVRMRNRHTLEDFFHL